jgi:hypothetical protein
MDNGNTKVMLNFYRESLGQTNHSCEQCVHFSSSLMQHIIHVSACNFAPALYAQRAVVSHNYLCIERIEEPHLNARTFNARASRCRRNKV